MEVSSTIMLGSVHPVIEAPAPIASRKAETFGIEAEDIGPRRLVHAAGAALWLLLPSANRAALRERCTDR